MEKQPEKEAVDSEGCPPDWQDGDCATSLKSFCQDNRYDVICSGSLMGIYYEEIESNAVGFKDDFDMFSMDFEEFLWAVSGKRTESDF